MTDSFDVPADRRSELYGLWADQMLTKPGDQLELSGAWRDNLTADERALVLMWDTAAAIERSELRQNP